jgi:ubiquinone/menaquinone biosynthesis C-methylase UbiE
MPFKHKRYRHDDESRVKWQNPEATLTEIGLASGMVFADLGCGEGFFALPAARIVGPEGQVYALDIDAEAINLLKQAAEKEGLGNIIAVAGEGESTVLCEACADIVFFGIVLHDFTDPAMVLRNAGRMVKPEGRLVNLDWKKEQMDLGPPVEIRFDEDKAARLISDAGFSVEKVEGISPYHYVITAKPGPSLPETWKP